MTFCIQKVDGQLYCEDHIVQKHWPLFNAITRDYFRSTVVHHKLIGFADIKLKVMVVALRDKEVYELQHTVYYQSISHESDVRMQTTTML